MSGYSDDNGFSGRMADGGSFVPKIEPLDVQFPSDSIYSRHIGESVATSSGSNVRASLLGMGFLPALIDKVIAEKGEDDIGLLVDLLSDYSGCPESKPESSDSTDRLFNDDRPSTPPEVSADIHPKEEYDSFYDVNDEKRATLLSMEFSVDEVNFALDKHDPEAPLHLLVDFILAFRKAEMPDANSGESPPGDEVTEECNNETLFQTVDTTVRLFEIGFTENQISAAIDKFGSDMPIPDLAEYILTGHVPESFSKKVSSCPSIVNNLQTGSESSLKRFYDDTFDVKEEEYNTTADFGPVGIGLEGDRKGKRPKPEYEYFYESSTSMNPVRRSREDDSKTVSNPERLGRSMQGSANSCSSVNEMVAKPPYFFYGNVVNISQDSWEKISQFLYGIKPEFVNTQFFSALSRKEGYVHNLPSDNRFHVTPKSPVSIEEAIPNTKKWWPSWDTRKLLCCITSETLGIPELCERLGKMLITSCGLLSPEQQRDILHQCRTLNLIWVGRYTLGPVEPEHLERILGYPLHHTRAAEWGLSQRLESLRHCFQIDTLGYHLSALKSMFPRGLVVLSIFSGIGGAEVALHRLGIRLKGVVSVETSSVKRMILKRWWSETGQEGDLVQLEDIQKMTLNKLETLIERFGGFDLIICQNSCTNSSKFSKIASSGDHLAGFDFTMFLEFVRMVHRSRSVMEKKRL